MPGRKGYLSIEGMDPSGSGKREFFVPQSKLEHLQRNGPKQHFYDALLLGEVLSDPVVVFQGLQREDFDAAYCYVKVPSKRFRSHDLQLPPFPGCTFLAFIRDDFVILDWEWRKIDSSCPGFPVNWQTDFRKRLWP